MSVFVKGERKVLTERDAKILVSSVHLSVKYVQHLTEVHIKRLYTKLL